MNRRGIALILCYMVIAILMVLGSVFLFSSVSESNIARRYVDSVRAFWVAEAGIAEAIANFPDSPLNANLGDVNSAYSTQTSLITGFTDRYRITSLGSANTESRTIEVIVKDSPPLEPGDIDAAIAITGNLAVGGGATINGDTEPNADLSFTETFGMTKAQLKAQADHLYIDPPNSVEPVEGITWIETTAGNELIISDSTWSGSGILIIEGSLKITGGDFNGILWVTGTLDMITGNPDIAGAILVDCGENEVKVTGSATITLDESTIDIALGALEDVPPVVLSWSEI